MKKRVARLHWDSSRGQMFYRLVFADGSMGDAITVTDLDTGNPSHRVQRRMREIEKKVIGTDQ